MGRDEAARAPKWTYFYLYVILDVFSRYAVGWTVQHRETASLAERLIAETLAKQQIARDQLTVHADRGSAVRSKPVAFLLANLEPRQHRRRHRDRHGDRGQQRTELRTRIPAAST